MKLNSVLTALVLLALPLSAAMAEEVMIEVANVHPGVFAFSPPWIAFHDGTFDAFDSGVAASPGIEAIAELGDFSVLSGEFAASGASGVDGAVMSPDPPPPFLPGEVGSMMFDVGDASMHCYFSFGAMLVPSNDFFIGNDDPMAYEVFDAGGNFLGPVVIPVYAGDAWDAGTEVNDVTFGAAFLVGQDATEGATEDGGVVLPLFDSPNVDAYLASMVGLDTPIGTITDALAPGDMVATITIVPEPGCLALAMMGVVLAVSRRR